jgi:hypothetical protein
MRAWGPIKHKTRTLRWPILFGLSVLPGFFALDAARAQIVSPDESALARTGLFARDRNVSVRQRPRPEYAPAGIHLGAFQLSPTLDTGLEYNDNIYATPTSTKSDEIFHVTPAVSLVSNWSQNQLTAYARGSFNEYVNHSTESTTNYAVGTAGRLDITRQSGMAGGVAFEHDTESRTDPNSPLTSIHPIQYDLASAFIGAAQSFNRLRLSARADVQDFSYDNGAANGGGVVYEKDRNHDAVTGTFRAEYAVTPDVSLFGNALVNTQSYRDQLPTDVSRNSDGYELTVGSNFDLTHLMRGEIYIGYLSQTYDDHRYKNVNGVSLRGVVEYFPTQLTTVTISGSRSVQDSIILGAGGYLDSTVAVQVDHELLRNLILTANITFENDDYSGISRTDDRNSESIGATYLMNRGVGLSLTYQHLENSSSGSEAGLNFDDNRVLASLTLHY